jgi:hypothetical protein
MSQSTSNIDSASKVSRDPAASPREKMADKAHDAAIVLNYLADQTYCPYCMRCPGIKRMTAISPLYWECSGCGGIHDERQVLT